MTQSDLIAALKKLDPANPNHWTSDGMPKLDTLKFMLGGQSVSRQDIETVAPGLNRANYVVKDDTPTEPESADPELAAVIAEKQEKVNVELKATEQKVDDMANTASLTIGVEVNLSNALEDILNEDQVKDEPVDINLLTAEELDVLIAEKQESLKEFDIAQRMVNKMRKERIDKLDELITAREKKNIKSNVPVQKRYLQSQGNLDFIKPENRERFVHPIDDPRNRKR